MRNFDSNNVLPKTQHFIVLFKNLKNYIWKSVHCRTGSEGGCLIDVIDKERQAGLEKHVCMSAQTDLLHILYIINIF